MFEEVALEDGSSKLSITGTICSVSITHSLAYNKYLNYRQANSNGAQIKANYSKPQYRMKSFNLDPVLLELEGIDKTRTGYYKSVSIDYLKISTPQKSGCNFRCYQLLYKEL